MNGPSPDLAKNILLRIKREERQRLIVKTAGFGAALAASLALAVYGYFDAAAEASRSGFFAFASLFFSDFSATAASFSDFAFSIIESFPVFSVSIFLSGVFLAVWSAAGFVGEVALIKQEMSSASA